MKNSRETLKNSLYQLLKMDYGFELYNYNDNMIRFSFYHLNSVYNAFCTSVYFRDKWTEPEINLQYAAGNKNVEKHAKQIVNSIINLYKLQKNFDLALSEIEFYKKRADAVFNAKYSIETILHTED